MFNISETVKKRIANKLTNLLSIMLIGVLAGISLLIFRTKFTLDFFIYSTGLSFIIAFIPLSLWALITGYSDIGWGRPHWTKWKVIY